MERLTYVDARGRVLFTPSEEVDENPDIGYDIRQIAEYGYREYLSLIAERLANREQCCEMLEGELKAYKDAEEQGLLLRLPAPLDGVESFSLDGKDTWFRLPCKVGDKVYQIHTLPKSNRKVLVEAIADEFFIALCTLEKRFGKTVFLTKEEAEAALEKMKGEEHEK